MDSLLNTGDCEYSLYLGCRHCKVCRVEEYAKKALQREREEEQAWIQAKIAQYEREFQ